MPAPCNVMTDPILPFAPDAKLSGRFEPIEAGLSNVRRPLPAKLIAWVAATENPSSSAERSDSVIVPVPVTLPKICAELFDATRMLPVFDSAIALRADKPAMPDMRIMPALLIVPLLPNEFQPLGFQIPLTGPFTVLATALVKL